MKALVASMMVLTLALNVASGQTTTIKDSFAPNGTSKAGDVLNSRSVEVGEAQWKATGNLYLSQDKPGVVTSNTGGFVAKLPIPDKGDEITVEAEVRPIVVGGEENWIAVGMGDVSSEMDLNWTQGLFVLVTDTGKFQAFACYGNGGAEPTVTIKVGKVLDFNSDDMTKVKFEYNRKHHTFSLYINEVAAIEHYTFKEGGFIPDTTFAGFSGFKQKQMTPSVKNFSVIVK